MSGVVDRLSDCFPTGTYAATALLRLMDIVETTSVPTAAVECGLQPRLLVNPDFVVEHAETPEKLTMLIMHELHHILLGHTSSLRPPGRADNFVFDCVINALISRMFPERAFVDLLCDYYADDSFPECLLRPPAGWDGVGVGGTPPGIASLPPPLQRQADEVYRCLYSEVGVTYDEVRELLTKMLIAFEIGDIPLLGGHDGGQSAIRCGTKPPPILLDAASTIIGDWVNAPARAKGRSFSGGLTEATVQPQTMRRARAQLAGLLRKVGGIKDAGRIRGTRGTAIVSPTPIIALDRRAAVLRSHGIEPMFYGNTVSAKRQTRVGERVQVYVDVSGSVEEYVGAIYGALLDCAAWVAPRVHLFSTEVESVRHADIRRGMVKTTGGTNIVCVARHMDANKVRRACIITDGLLGRSRGHDRDVLEKVRLGVAYVGESSSGAALANLADYAVDLGVLAP
jgi:hypothetical protein